MREFQRDAESLMTLTFTAYAPDGVTADADHMQTQAYLDKGPTAGKVQGNSAVGKNPVARAVSVGDVELAVVDGGLHIPLSSFIQDGVLQLVAGPRGIGWELLCTAASSADDQAVVGRRYLVVSAPVKSRASARRLDVVELP